MSELHTHQLLTDDSGTETIEPEETIISDEKPHEIAEKTFADYNVRADIVESLADAGITHPFPIQAMTLPVALSGHDIIGQAKTGTGKTLGFGIPALQRVVGPDDAGLRHAPGPRRPAGPRDRARPASWPSRLPATCRTPPASATPVSPRSTAAAPTSRRSRPCRRASKLLSARPAASSTCTSRSTSS